MTQVLEKEGVLEILTNAFNQGAQKAAEQIGFTIREIWGGVVCNALKQTQGEKAARNWLKMSFSKQVAEARGKQWSFEIFLEQVSKRLEFPHLVKGG